MVQPQQKRKNNVNNFFKQNEQRFGEDFMDKLNARDMQNNAIRVFRDIAKGNINIASEGKYFLNPQFLDACFEAANSKLLYHSTNYQGVLLLVNQTNSTDPNVLSVLDYNKRCTEAYGIILQNLTAIKSTGDANYAVIMANNLRNYRFNI